MSLIDIAILVILALFLLKGVLRGLLKEVCSLLGLVLGCLLAYLYHQPLAVFFQQKIGLPDSVCVWGAYVVIFLTVVILFGLLGFVLSRFVKLIFLGGFNRLAGAIFGLVEGVVLLSVVLLALDSAVAPAMFKRLLQEAQLAPPFIQLGNDIFALGRHWLQR